MADFNESNERPNFMKTSYGDNKLDKSNQLTPEMTIHPTPPDSATRTLASLGRGEA